MNIEFGSVQEYNIDRGFGHVSRTFEKVKGYRSFNRRHQNGVWFHIGKIKHNYPGIAKELDNGLFASLSFWYEFDKDADDRLNVSRIWLDPEDMPNPKREGLVTYIEQQWCVTTPLPGWLDSVTLAIVGTVRRDELKQIYDERVRQHRDAEEQKQVQRQARITQSIAQRSIHIKPARERFRTERGVIEAIFASNEMHGLPSELQKIVRSCPRHSRRNILSHQPGGSDVVVAYSLGDAILYDWIKNVDWYISAFEREDPGFHLHITSIYGRFYEDLSKRGIGVFCPIWTREDDGALQSVVKACVSRYQRQMEIGHTTLHQEAKEYWKNKYDLSAQEVETLPTLYKQYMEEKGVPLFC